jgi:drug/metabolite transporter (DMT)-like permease
MPSSESRTDHASRARSPSFAHKTLLLTVLAMTAFAANSVLCRMGLGKGAIDPSTYTLVRLASGAVMLWVIRRFARSGDSRKPTGGLPSAFLLFAYAITFSFAYISLGVGVGALILFAAVQATMVTAGLMAGERPSVPEWLGFVLAILGLLYLLAPRLSAPSPFGAALMAAAGIAWGLYSLRGRKEPDALAATASNFIRSVPMAIAVSLCFWPVAKATLPGLLLASASGAVASGCGYVIWYAALRGLTATLAATVQLSVPVLAAAGGVVFLSETLSIRLAISSILILGGIGLSLVGRARKV